VGSGSIEGNRPSEIPKTDDEAVDGAWSNRRVALPAVLFVDVSPRLFGTALAKVLTWLGYDVDVHGPPRSGDVAIVSSDRPNSAKREIRLFGLESGPTLASVMDGPISERHHLRSFDELLDLIDRIARPGTVGGGEEDR
jgi:hypothetical protein